MHVEGLLKTILDGKILHIKGSVASHVDELLLGMDFLKTKCQTWDFQKDELMIDGVEYKMKSDVHYHEQCYSTVSEPTVSDFNGIEKFEVEHRPCDGVLQTVKGGVKKRVRFEDSDADDTFNGINNLFETKITDEERVDRRLEKDVSERDAHTFNSPNSEIHIACNLELYILLHHRSMVR